MEQVVREVSTRYADAGGIGTNVVALHVEHLAELGRPRFNELPADVCPCTQQAITNSLPAASIAHAELQVWRLSCRVKI